MTERKLREELKSLERFRKEVTSSREVALKFLISIGVLTKSGKPTKRYKHLCIPKDQA